MNPGPGVPDSRPPPSSMVALSVWELRCRRALARLRRFAPRVYTHKPAKLLCTNTVRLAPVPGVTGSLRIYAAGVAGTISSGTGTKTHYE